VEALSPTVKSQEETTRDLDLVVVGGCGHVGLPLALCFAEAGATVGIYDIDGWKVEQVRAGEMPFMERGADKLLAAVLPTGRLEVSSDRSMIGRSDAVIVVIGTPIDEFMNPSMRIYERAIQQLVDHLREGALVILRSTVFPGTTEYVEGLLAQRGLRADVAFAPERIAEGYALDEIRSRRGTQFDPDLTDRFLSLVEALRAKHSDLDAYLGKAGRNSPFLQARNKIRLMLAEEREQERKATVSGNETRH